MRLLTDTEDRAPEVNIVPLMDVIFAILTFFVMTALLLNRTEGLPVDLPSASSGKTQDQTKLVVTIDPQGALALDRQPTDLASLTSKIQALAAKNKASLVVINADEKVTHGQVVAVMDRIRQTPGVKMGIATKRK